MLSPDLPRSHALADPAAALSSDGGFDFLLGRWAVRHRKLRRRLAGASDWFEFPGTLDVRPILGGLGNVDENVLEDPAGRYLASSLRLFDATDLVEGALDLEAAAGGVGLRDAGGRFGAPEPAFGETQRVPAEPQPLQGEQTPAQNNSGDHGPAQRRQHPQIRRRPHGNTLRSSSKCGPSFRLVQSPPQMIAVP